MMRLGRLNLSFDATDKFSRYKHDRHRTLSSRPARIYLSIYDTIALVLLTNTTLVFAVPLTRDSAQCLLTPLGYFTTVRDDYSNLN